jgi:hypothetical protein
MTRRTLLTPLFLKTWLSTVLALYWLILWWCKKSAR